MSNVPNVNGGTMELPRYMVTGVHNVQEITAMRFFDALGEAEDSACDLADDGWVSIYLTDTVTGADLTPFVRA